MISYYDLLGMVKDENAPERIEVSLTYGTSRIYKAEYDGIDGDFSYYYLDGNEDESYRYYLSKCFLESSMFDKCIKILDEEDEFEDIEEITIRDTTIGFPNGEWTARNMDKAFAIKINQLIKNQNKIIERLKGLEK